MARLGCGGLAVEISATLAKLGWTCPIILALTNTLRYPPPPAKYISVSSFAEVQLETLVPGEV